MDVDYALSQAFVPPNNFPGKMWRMVNCPSNTAVRWDSSGDGVIIEQKLFEEQVLSPGGNTSDSASIFKTTNFTSFFRQLNLYGFRKIRVVRSGAAHCVDCDAADNWTHHFYNPNFKRNHPELLLNLKRLTPAYKAIVEAGIEETGWSSFLGQTRDASPHPYRPNRPQSVTEYNRTPVPPRSSGIRHTSFSFPTPCTTDKRIPISVFHPNHGIVSGPANVPIHQGFPGFANTGQTLNNFNPHRVQFQPGFYNPVFQRYSPGSVPLYMTGSSPQTAVYPHHGFYQPSHPVNMSSHESRNQYLQNVENREMKESNVNVDTIFAMMEELHPCQINLVTVVTPERQVTHSSRVPASSQDDNSVTTTKASPSSPWGTSGGTHDISNQELLTVDVCTLDSEDEEHQETTTSPLGI